MKILFSGGGTLGPVTPLLAMKDVFDKEEPGVTYIWLGTKNGPEQGFLESENIHFYPIQSGKLRRYFSLRTFTAPFRILAGTVQSIRIILREDPDVCISAGGFVSVPVHIAAWLLGVPTWVHQQDVKKGLANRIMSPFATVITTSTEALAKSFNPKKTIWLGNPVRAQILSGDKARAMQVFSLYGHRPTVLIMGGGTGSLKINQMMVEALPLLSEHCQILHITGQERPQEVSRRLASVTTTYRVFKMMNEELPHAYRMADVVVSRGGFGSLSELAALKKAVILVPKPGHQEYNVKMITDNKAAVMVDERIADGRHLAEIIMRLLKNPELRMELGEKLHKLLPLASKEKVISTLYRATRGV